MEDKEIELMDYIGIFWKRKWIIILGTLACMVIAGVLSFLINPVYEIDSIVQTGKFLTENEAGNFEEIVVEGPQQIADKINHQSYEALIMAELDKNKKEIPAIKAEHIGDTFLTRMWIRDSDIELSKTTLNSLIEFIKNDIDEKINIEISNIDALINADEIEKERRVKQIEILKKKLQIIDQRKKDINEEMKTVKDKLEQLEQEQLRVLKKENRTEAETLGLLLYSTEIQQSLRTNDYLNEKLSIERLKEEDINSDLQTEDAFILKIENTIRNLKERKGRIDYTKIIKNPTSSTDPVWPRKKLNVLIAAIIGFMLFTVLMLFYEFFDKQKI